MSIIVFRIYIVGLCCHAKPTGSICLLQILPFGFAEQFVSFRSICSISHFFYNSWLYEWIYSFGGSVLTGFREARSRYGNACVFHWTIPIFILCPVITHKQNLSSMHWDSLWFLNRNRWYAQNMCGFFRHSTCIVDVHFFLVVRSY